MSEPADAQSLFAKAFAAAPVSLTITSLVSGRLLQVNDTFVAITGYSREEAVGRTTVELGLWADTADRAIDPQRPTTARRGGKHAGGGGDRLRAVRRSHPDDGSGFQMHLAKPIDPHDLVAAVAALHAERTRA